MGDICTKTNIEDITPDNHKENDEMIIFEVPNYSSSFDLVYEEIEKTFNFLKMFELLEFFYLFNNTLTDSAEIIKLKENSDKSLTKDTLKMINTMIANHKFLNFIEKKIINNPILNVKKILQ